MKLSVSTYSLARWRRENDKSLEDSIDQIAGMNAKGVDFSGLDEKAAKNPAKRAEQLRKRAERKGLKIPSYCVGAELLVPLDEQRQVVERLKGEVDVAATLGVRSMRHDVTRGFGEPNRSLRIPRTFDAVLKHIVPAIREVADYAKTKGVKTSLENHGFYMQESKRVEKLIKTVNHPNYGLTLDMGNFLCVNENPVTAVKRLAKYAVMAHVKDFHVRKKSNKPATGWFDTPTEIALRGAICGHGEIDIPAELKLLRNARYDGFLSLEFEGVEDPLQAVKWGLDYLRDQLAQLK